MSSEIMLGEAKTKKKEKIKDENDEVVGERKWSKTRNRYSLPNFRRRK